MATCVICWRDDVVRDDWLFGFATSTGKTTCVGCFYRETGKRLAPHGWLGREMITAANAA